MKKKVKYLIGIIFLMLSLISFIITTYAVEINEIFSSTEESQNAESNNIATYIDENEENNDIDTYSSENEENNDVATYDEENDNDNNYYTIKWPAANLNTPIENISENRIHLTDKDGDVYGGYVKIHYVKEDGRPIQIGNNKIHSGSQDDPTNVKGIFSLNGFIAQDGMVDVLNPRPWDPPQCVYYCNLTNLVSSNKNEIYYNENFDNLSFKRAYILKDPNNPNEKTYIMPYLVNLKIRDENTYDGVENKDGNKLRFGYFEDWFELDDRDDIYSKLCKYWKSVDTKDIYLEYCEKPVSTTAVKNTVTSKEAGLRIHLFDYSGGSLNNIGSGMWTASNETASDSKSITGHYSKVLTEKNPFPIYTYGNVSEDLQKYFDPTYRDAGPTADSEGIRYVGEVDGLLQKRNDENGGTVYYYDSAQNAAVLDESTNRFTLYNELVANMNTLVSPYNNLEAQTAHKRGNFFPLNKIDTSTIMGYSYDSNTIGMPIYALSDPGANYHFGLYMEGEIYQPFEGTRPTFYIRGDDDILVYIDDVLVIDMGGIHNPLAGEINFATGKVRYQDNTNDANNKAHYVETTLKELLNGQGNVYNSNRKLDDSDFNGDTFKDNTIHTIKVFYAERGGGASNLRIETKSPEANLTIANSFWLDEKAEEVKNEKFVPFDGFDKENIKNARYMLQEVQTIEDIKNARFRLSYVEIDSNSAGTQGSIATYEDFKKSNGTYTFTNLKKEYLYYVEVLNASGKVIAKSDPINATLGEIKVTIDENADKDNVVIDVQYATGANLTAIENPKFDVKAPWEIPEGKKVVAGHYTFSDIDWTKKYQVAQQLYYDNQKGEHIIADGSTEKSMYEFTSVFVDSDAQLKDQNNPLSHRQSVYVTTNTFNLIEAGSNEVKFQDIVFRNVYADITIDKNIIVNDKKQKDAEVPINHTVSYEIIGNVPNYDNYPENTNVLYKIIDISDSELNIQSNSIMVWRLKDDGNDWEEIEDGKYTVSVDEDGIFSLILNNPRDYSSNTIRITYEAIATKFTKDDITWKNTVYAEYTSNPDNFEDTTEKTEEISTYVTVLNSTDFKFTKVKNEKRTEGIEGTRFLLYQLICTNSEHKDGYHDTIIDVNNPSECWKRIGDVTSDVNGGVLFQSIELDKQYRLIEVEALTDRIKPEGQWTITYEYSTNPTITLVGENLPPEFIINEDGSLLLPNMSKYDIPLLGSIGMKIFIITGAILVVSGVYLTKYRKKSYATRGKRYK